MDIDVPAPIQNAWTIYERARYGRVLYAIYRPTDDRAGTIAALTAMLDILFQERGHTPLKEFQDDALAGGGGVGHEGEIVPLRGAQSYNRVTVGDGC